MNKPGRRELNKIQCRQRILKASRRLFSAKGYEDTTMEDVAERAEVSKATLYNYFSSKDSLLIGIAEDELEQMRKLIDTDLLGEQDALEKLRRVLELLVMDAISFLPLGRKITYLNACEGSDLFAAYLDMQDIFHQLAAQAQEQGRLRRDVPAKEIVDMVMGVYLIAQFQWPYIAGESEAVWAEKFRRTFDLALQGLLV